MITKIQWFLNKCIDSKLVTGFVLTLSLAVTRAALAEYQPPLDQPPPHGYTTSSGPRGGCEGIGGPPLTVLAPHKHVGQTASKHPTFAWFVPDSKPLPMEFTLYEYDPASGSKVAQKISLRSKPGIMKLSLPEDKPGLTVGQRYIWQVEVVCNPNRPSQNLLARAEIKVVEVPPTLSRARSATSDRLEMAEIYARAGLWYDALHEALEPAEDSRLGVAANLLEDLAKLEEPEATQVESRQSASLRQIAVKSFSPSPHLPISPSP